MPARNAANSLSRLQGLLFSRDSIGAAVRRPQSQKGPLPKCTKMPVRNAQEGINVTNGLRRLRILGLQVTRNTRKFAQTEGRDAMTIVYIHGVKVRDPAHGQALERPFRRWIEPALDVGNAACTYQPVFWGDIAAKFRWELESRPKTVLLRQGAEGGFAGLGSLREAGRQSPLDRPAATMVNGPVLGGPSTKIETAIPPLSSVPPAQRADFLADLYLAARPRKAQDPVAEEPAVAALADASAIVAANWNTIISQRQTESDRAAALMQAVEVALTGDALIQQGGFEDWMTRAGETLKRAASWPADAVSTFFSELRPVANEFVAYFIGDVLAYLNTREAGEIPLRVLDALQKAQARKKETGERIVVVTHSMGGQLFYDAATFFALREPALVGLEIDHWISCGSQVSFFAELGLFMGQPGIAKPQKLKRPDCVKAWTNFYDRNDLVGFIMQPVFDGVDDIEYDTGYGLAFAHTGFLARPSFFEAIAQRVAKAGS